MNLKNGKNGKKGNALFFELLQPILYIIIGVVCILVGETLIDILGYILGCIFIVAGLVLNIIFLTRDPIINIHHNEMLLGMGAIAVGIVLLVQIELLAQAIPIILGCLVVISGAEKLQQAVNMLRLKLTGWIPTLFIAVLNIAFGVVLIVNPKFINEVLMIVIGVGLIFSAISDIVFTIFYNKQIKDQDPMNVQYREIAPNDTQN